MPRGEPSQELLCHLDPLSVPADAVQHRPVTPPEHPLRAKTGEHMGHIGRELAGRTPRTGLSEEARQLAIDRRVARQLLEICCPGPEATAGDIRLAGMVQD